MKRNLCECGCGGYANLGRRYIKGHNNKGKKVSEETIQKQKETKKISKEIREGKKPVPELPFCECGCGGRVAKLGNRFINGHNQRGKPSPMKGKIPWNKDKTKENDNILKIVSEKVSKTRKVMFANGELKVWSEGKTKENDIRIQRQAETLSMVKKKYFQTEEGKKHLEKRSEKEREFYATAEGQQWLDDNRRGENNPCYGKESWKKGLTKETEESINRGAEKLSKTKKEFFATDEGQKWLDDNWRGKNHPSYGNRKAAKKLSKSLKEFYTTKEGKLLAKNCGLKMSKIMHEKWQDPYFIKMMTDSWNKKPNQIEKNIDGIVQLLFHNEYKYNGNYELGISIGGKIPDFVNVNGKKKAIDLFGDYWHREENPQIRIDLFKKYGWDLLVIWEHELKDRDAVIRKIVKLHGIESDYITPQKTISMWIDNKKEGGDKN